MGVNINPPCISSWDPMSISGLAWSRIQKPEFEGVNKDTSKILAKKNNNE